MLGSDRRDRAIGCGHRDLALAGQPAVPREHLHLVLPHQELHALGVGRDRLLAVVLHGTKIERDAGRDDAILGRFAGLVVDMGALQQRLGGDAAAKQAGAAEPRVSLHNRCLEAELRAAHRGNISAGTGADDDHIVIRFRHSKPRISRNLQERIERPLVTV